MAVPVIKDENALFGQQMETRLNFSFLPTLVRNEHNGQVKIFFATAVQTVE